MLWFCHFLDLSAATLFAFFLFCVIFAEALHFSCFLAPVAAGFVLVLALRFSAAIFLCYFSVLFSLFYLLSLCKYTANKI